MPLFRVEVAWKGPKPTSLEAMECVLSKYWMPLLPSTSARPCPSLQFKQDGLLTNALVIAFGIQDTLAERYGIHCSVYVNEREILTIVGELERQIICAVSELKRTRAIVGDKRFARIRLRLEHAIAMAVGEARSEEALLRR